MTIEEAVDAILAVSQYVKRDGSHHRHWHCTTYKAVATKKFQREHKLEIGYKLELKFGIKYIQC